ncbi:helix-turn-helix domain-containing protein [Amphritea atlantica]|uniref:Helix-turn-helix domain-containing protein n=1 Tax=Amphritea atlantica TaxID=355243 RepID=A0ABY5GPG2_9GAMM|nr:helix-turn-helix domain-containing protein [Amphritea atlantica]
MQIDSSPAHADKTLYRSFETFDIEQHANGMSGWQVSYDQVSAGQFSGHITELNLKDLQLVRDRSNRAIVKTGRAWEGSLSFSVPYRPLPEHFYCDGNLSSPDSILIAKGDCLPELLTPENLDIICITVNTETLINTARQQNIEFYLDSNSDGHYITKFKPNFDLLRYLREVLSEDNINTLIKYESLQKNVKETLSQHLIDIVDRKQAQYLGPVARKKVVDKAREYVLSNLEAPPSIIELCNIIGTSRRKLQYCFQDTLGINPVTFLRLIRLNAAHRDLLNQNNETSVQDIAAKWGFLHLSRFSSEYKTLFKELPSETLRNKQ